MALPRPRAKVLGVMMAGELAQIFDVREHLLDHASRPLRFLGVELHSVMIDFAFIESLPPHAR